MTHMPRLVRGTLPALVALAVASGLVLPASAQQAPTRAAQWWLTALNVSRAWQLAPGEGKGVTVAVLSTGVDAAHKDLTGSVVSGPDYSGSGRKAGGPYWGEEGTAVASLVAGHGHGKNGASGITGIAPAARILSIRVTLEYDDPLNSDAALTRRIPDAIAAGIRYAVAHGASVIALPLDPGTLGPADAGDPAAAGGSPAERAAVSYALTRGVVVLAPAGDNGASTGAVNYPADYPGVIAVGATDRDGQLAPFSCRHSYVALTAPGAGLTVGTPDGGYATLASTDMSAALAAGVAALIRSRFPLLTPAEVAQALENGTARRTGAHPQQGTGWGALDAAGALAAAARIATPHRAPAHTTPPVVRTPPARQVSPRRAAKLQTGLGDLAGTLLEKVVIAAGALIAALACALILTAMRRRRAQTARVPLSTLRPGQGGGSHARRSRAATMQQAPAQRRPIQMDADDWRQSRALNAAGTPSAVIPRIVPVAAAGAIGMTGRARRKKTTGKPPWEPASPPAQPLPTLPIAGSRPRTGQHAALAPWEQAPAQFATAPDTMDLASSTGPMYLWNPASSTGPQPVIIEWEDNPSS
jgi:Subtilase family